MSFKTRLAGTDRLMTAVLTTIPSAAVTQALASAGADMVIVDMEHGAVDYGTAHAMVAATAGTDCSPCIRVSRIDEAEVKRALDCGAEGICLPMVNTADDARAAVSMLHYPPKGTRGFGPFLSHSRWEGDMVAYARASEERVYAVPLIETAEAVENIDAICAVDGMDMMVIAAFDLSTSLGVPGELGHPRLRAATERVEAAARAAGIPLATNVLSAEMADGLWERGYRVMAAFDVLMLKARVREMAGWGVPQGA